MGLIGLNMLITGVMLLVIHAFPVLFPWLDFLWLSWPNAAQLSFIAAGLIYLVWVASVLGNLRSAGLNLKYSPGWAIMVHIIPIINLYEPLKLASYYYSASLSLSMRAQGEPDTVKLPGFIRMWWIMGLASSFLPVLSPFLTFMDGFGVFFQFLVAGLHLASAFYLIKIIRDVNGFLLIGSTITSSGGQSGEEVF